METTCTVGLSGPLPTLDKTNVGLDIGLMLGAYLVMGCVFIYSLHCFEKVRYWND